MFSALRADLRYNFFIQKLSWMFRPARYSGRVGHSTQEGRMDGLLRSLVKTVRRRLRDDEEVTVEAVTRELGYTRQYISGRFHRITGRLLSHFLKEKRLEKAARLLKSGNLRVSQVARRCGFDSENYFRQQFRERYGMSPRQFRANGSAGRLGPRRLLPQAQTA
jgi:AraC-like DNA-binding protein